MVVLGIDAQCIFVLYFNMSLSEYSDLVELRNVQWDDKLQEMKIEVWVQGRHITSPVIHIADKKAYFHRKLKGFPLI